EQGADQERWAVVGRLGASRARFRDPESAGVRGPQRARRAPRAGSRKLAERLAAAALPGNGRAPAGAPDSESRSARNAPRPGSGAVPRVPANDQPRAPRAAPART